MTFSVKFNPLHYGDKKVKQQNLLTFFSRDKDNIQGKGGDSAESLPSTSASSLGETEKQIR